MKSSVVRAHRDTGDRGMHHRRGSSTRGRQLFLNLLCFRILSAGRLLVRTILSFPHPYLTPWLSSSRLCAHSIFSSSSRPRLRAHAVCASRGIPALLLRRHRQILPRLEPPPQIHHIAPADRLGRGTRRLLRRGLRGGRPRSPRAWYHGTSIPMSHSPSRASPSFFASSFVAHVDAG
jgi:hypothetical protein